MSAQTPSPEEARAALSEVGLRARQVRHSDLHLFWMLLAIGVADAIVATALSFGPRGGAAGPLIILVALVVALIAAVLIALRIRAYSRGGMLVYFATIVVFSFWNALVISVSVTTGFFSRGQPTYHFGISEAIASLPLWVGAFVITRRSRQRR